MSRWQDQFFIVDKVKHEMSYVYTSNEVHCHGNYVNNQKWSCCIDSNATHVLCFDAQMDHLEYSQVARLCIVSEITQRDSISGTKITPLFVCHFTEQRLQLLSI